jgi:hypothetical protein
VASAKGRDLGRMILPAGIIELGTTWPVFEHRGMIVEGAGATATKDGPRSHGSPGWSPITIGTSLFWGGSLGGTMMTVDRASHFVLRDMDFHLAENAMGSALFGVEEDDSNVDTFHGIKAGFRNLAVGFLVVHMQGLAWRIISPDIVDSAGYQRPWPQSAAGPQRGHGCSSRGSAIAVSRTRSMRP